jgi:hypothetical protein
MPRKQIGSPGDRKRPSDPRKDPSLKKLGTNPETGKKEK